MVERFQAICEAACGDDLLIKSLGGIDIVVIVIEASLGERFGLGK